MDCNVTWRSMRFLLFVFLLAMLAAGNLFSADETKRDAQGAGTSGRKLRTPFCGLYCLYAAMKLSGQEIGFTELLKPEYVGSRKGSSLAELQLAAEDYGMYAVSVNKLTTQGLRSSPYPIILHVKSTMDKEDYGHFELFLGTENGQARLFNPPEPVRSVPFHELAPR